jgi:uncharacterized membrane protein (UPF0127 family)
LAVVLLISATALFVFEEKKLATKILLQTDSGHIFSVEVVESMRDRRKGLSNREELPYNEGMWFVFPNSGRHGIWMKEMRFPIDIIWLDESTSVVHIAQSVSPDTFPTVFYPDSEAKYVLETNAGWSREHNIQINTKITPK